MVLAKACTAFDLRTECEPMNAILAWPFHGIGIDCAPATLESTHMRGHSITMLGTGLIGDLYTAALHAQRSRDRVRVVYSRTEERGTAFSQRWDIPEHTTDLVAAAMHPETDIVVVGVPNHLHVEAVEAAIAAGKAVLVTKPLGRNADEARRILETVERAGVFGGYLEDLCYTPKALKAMAAVERGAIGDVTWVRSRETHPGPHSAWFWDGRLTGGGAIVDLGCHCIEVIRGFVGKGNRPVEVMCHTDTLVHPIADDDNAVALIHFESGAIGQFEVSWTFRGGMDLRDEVAGTHGTIWIDHSLRTGLEIFSAGGAGGYVAEKAETNAGWLFPLGDEMSELGFIDMFTDMFDALDTQRQPRETLYDGYIVNAVMDASYRSAKSRRWEPVELFEWRGGETPRIGIKPEIIDGKVVIKRELLPDGRHKLIVKDPETGDFSDLVVEG